MTIFFISDTITIRRLRPYGAAKQNYSATFTAYAADIQPLGPNRGEHSQGRIGLDYEAYVDVGCPVEENDEIVTGGKKYKVRAMEIWQGASLLDCKHLLLVAVDGG